MITLKQILEQKKNTIVLAWGRLNPPTSGHELLINAVAKLAKKYDADHLIYLTKTQDPKKNPLNIEQKLFYARKSFPGMNIVGANDRIRTFIEAVKSLSGKYDNLVMVAGSDRVIEYKTILDKYNGKEFDFENITVVSAGERDPDSDSASGMSATKMRQAAAEGNFEKFKIGVPSKLGQINARKMFDDLRFAMGIKEENDVREAYINDKIFSVGDIVSYQNEEYTITFRGSNFLILENENGSCRAWLKDCINTGKVNEAIMVKQQDKLRAARIIAMALGYTDAENKTNPAEIVNAALRSIKNNPLNKEAKDILKRMLELAKKLEIKFDENIITEDMARADYKITKSGRKYRPIIKDKDSVGKSPYIKPASDNSVTESEEEEIDDSYPHNLMHKPDTKQSEYKRLRKIHLKMHESEDKEDEFDEDEIEDLLKDISDDDVIEYGYEDDEFHIVDDETHEIIKESTEDNEQILNEVLSRIERMRAKVRMLRSKAKRERSLKIALKKRSNGQVLSKRARRIAVKMLEKKLARKPLSQLSVAEKERLEARIQRMKPIINRIALKMLPRVRQVEKERLEHKTTSKE